MRHDREKRTERDARKEHLPWRPEEYPRTSRFDDRREQTGYHHDYAGRESEENFENWRPADRFLEKSYRGRGPQNYARSDERIREDVCDRLTEDPYIDAADVSVEVKEAEVTLRGTVSERHMKHLAEDCAASVSGVREVHNQLRTARSESIEAEK